MNFKMKSRILKSVQYIFLTAVALICIFPFVYAVYTSLLHKSDIDKLVSFTSLTLENYIYIFTKSDILRWYMNSCIVTFSIVAGNLAVNTLAAYALARIRFPGRNFFFFMILGMMMIPYQILIIPLFRMEVKFGWLNSYQGLILPFLFQGFLVFLMRQFFMTIPDALEEAAKIDGLSKGAAFFRIILPLSKAGIATQIIYHFASTWNFLVWGATFVNDKNYYILPVGLNTLKNTYFEYPGYTMSGVVLMTLPIVLIFVIFQKYFIQGIASSGIKG